LIFVAIPGAAIVAPDGSYQVQPGYTTKDRFIEFVENARRGRPVKPVPDRPANPWR
jgi:hypothetical protein